MNDIPLVTLFDLKVKHQEQVFKYHHLFSFLPEISFCLTTNGDGPYGRNKLYSFLLLRRANYSPLFQLKRKILEKDVDWLNLGQLIHPEYPGQIPDQKAEAWPRETRIRCGINNKHTLEPIQAM